MSLTLHATPHTSAAASSAGGSEGGAASTTAARTYTVVTRTDAEGREHTYCVWAEIIVGGQAKAYVNLDNNDLADKLKKAVQNVWTNAQANASPDVQAVLTESIKNGLNFTADKVNDTAVPGAHKTTLTLSSGSKKCSLVNTQAETNIAVTGLKTVLDEAKSSGDFVDMNGKKIVDPRAVFAENADEKSVDAANTAAARNRDTLTLDLVTQLDTPTLDSHLRNIGNKIPGIQTYPTQEQPSSSNLGPMRLATQNVDKTRPCFIPIQLRNGEHVYLYLDNNTHTLYHFNPTRPNLLSDQDKPESKLARINPLEKQITFPGNEDDYGKDLEKFIKHNGVTKFRNYSVDHGGISSTVAGVNWYKHLCENRTNTDEASKFPSSKPTVVKVPELPAGIVPPPLTPLSGAVPVPPIVRGGLPSAGGGATPATPASVAPSAATPPSSSSGVSGATPAIPTPVAPSVALTSEQIDNKLVQTITDLNQNKLNRDNTFKKVWIDKVVLSLRSINNSEGKRGQCLKALANGNFGTEDHFNVLLANMEKAVDRAKNSLLPGELTERRAWVQALANNQLFVDRVLAEPPPPASRSQPEPVFEHVPNPNDLSG